MLRDSREVSLLITEYSNVNCEHHMIGKEGTSMTLDFQVEKSRNECHCGGSIGEMVT